MEMMNQLLRECRNETIYKCLKFNKQFDFSVRTEQQATAAAAVAVGNENKQMSTEKKAHEQFGCFKLEHTKLFASFLLRLTKRKTQFGRSFRLPFELRLICGGGHTLIYY